MSKVESFKSQADLFVEQNLAKYGILGSNNFGGLITDYQGKFLRQEWSLENHFQFGFNGESFNHRSSSHDFYWVNYAQKPRFRKSFKENVLAAISHFYSKFGVFYLTAHGGPTSLLVESCCQELGYPYRLISLNISDLPLQWKHRTNATVEVYNSSTAELNKFFDEFNEISPCVDAEVLLQTFLATRVDGPFIMESYSGLNFEDFNFSNGSPVGPPNWNLVDSEKRTAPCRFLEEKKKGTLVHLFHYSPELMLSIMENPRFVRIFTEQENAKRIQNSYSTHLEVLYETFSTLVGYDFSGLPIVLQKWLQEASGQLSKKERMYSRDIWATPISAFGRHWELKFDYLSGSDDVYGHVF